MRSLFTLLFCFLLTFLSGQSSMWPEIGTEWYYSQYKIGPPNQTAAYNRLWIDRDTILGGLEARIMHWQSRDGNGSSSNIASRYVRSEHDSVYVWNAGFQEWFLMYDFGAGAGDSLVLYPTDGVSAERDTALIVIDSVVTENYRGVPVSVQYFTMHSFGFFYLPSPNVIGIGNTRWFFYEHPLQDPPDGGDLTCYLGDNIQIGDKESCDFLNSTDNLDRARVSVLPNPTNGELIIEAEGDIQSIEIISNSGVLVYSYEGNVSSIEIMNPGLYLLKIKVHKEVIIKRVVVR